MLRNNAARAINNFIIDAGYQPYSVGMSSREIAQGISGVRDYHQVRDLVLPHRADPITDNHVLTMIDVDYYVDLDEYLQMERPIIMYTFVPNSVAGECYEASYTFDERNVLHMNVDGGAEYRHELWDYSGDMITVRINIPWYNLSKIFTSVYWFGALVVYSVHKYSTSDDPQHRIIGLFPKHRFDGWASWWLPSNPVKRFTVSQKVGSDGSVFNVAEFRHAGQRIISFGRAGEFYSASVPYDVFHTIRENFNLTEYKNIGNVHRVLSELKAVPVPTLVAPLLFAVLRNGVSTPKRLSAVGVGLLKTTQDHVHYHAALPNPFDIGKLYARVVLPPLTDPDQGACSPTMSYNDDVVCVEKRLTDVKNTVQPPAKYYQYASEFVQFVVPEPAKGVPIHMDEVYAHQTGPFQRARNAMTQMWLGHTRAFIRSFQKKEFYAKYSPPRNISTLPTAHNLNLSTYTYAFKADVLSKCAWYLPTLTPFEIATRLQEFVRFKPWITYKDFEKFDGTISQWLRHNVQIPIYTRWCSDGFRNDLSGLLENECRAFGVTSEGVAYSADGTTLSGSAITTDGNTIFNAFHDYCSARNSNLDPEQAWAAIGLCYGDDGVSALSPEVMQNTASDLGLRVKVGTCREHEPVGLLGRVFVDPWVTPTSIQDPLRTISKLHLSVAPKNVSDYEAAVRRVTGYLITDPLTPIIADYCNAVVRCLSLHPPLEMDIEPYSHDLSWSAIIALESGPWPQLLGDTDLMRTIVADMCNIVFDELMQIIKALNQAQSLSDFPIHCIPHKRTVTYPVLVGGQLLEPIVDAAPVKSDVMPRTPGSRRDRNGNGQQSNDKRRGNRSDTTAPSPTAQEANGAVSRRDVPKTKQSAKRRPVKPDGNVSTVPNPKTSNTVSTSSRPPVSGVKPKCPKENKTPNP
jgi:hypothetical protein